MADYPANFPQPDDDSYSGTQDHGLLRTPLPVHLVNQSGGFNAPRRELNVTFSMTNDLYTSWILWVRENAYKWFNMPVVSSAPSTGILTTQSVRFISDLAYTKRGDNWLSVGVTMEITTGQAGLILPGDTNSFDAYIDGPFRTAYGLSLWLQGYRGGVNSANDAELTGWNVDYCGYGITTELSTALSLTGAGKAFDPSGTEGVTVGMLAPSPGGYTVSNSTFSISGVGEHNQSVSGSQTTTGGGSGGSFQTVDTQGRHNQEYEYSISVPSVDPNGAGFTVCNEPGSPGNNTIWSPPLLTDTNTPFLDQGKFEMSVSGGAGSPTATIFFQPFATSQSQPGYGMSFTASVNGHAGGYYSWSTTTWDATADYTFHVLMKYRKTITGDVASTVLNANPRQGIYWAARGAASSTGINILMDGDNLVVQHGEANIYQFGLFTFVDGTDYQIIVVNDTVAGELKLYVNGNLEQTLTGVNPVIIDASPQGEYVGRITRAGLNNNTEIFPLQGEWQHMFHTSAAILDVEATALYNEWINAA